MARQFAIVTGASTGIGYHLADICAKNGFDLLVAADEPKIHEAAEAFRRHGGRVEALEADLSTAEGVEALYAASKAFGQPVDALLANAGRGLGRGFLDQDWERAKAVVETNVTGTIHLIHLVGRDMRARDAGRILIVGSIAGFIPGAFQAVYNGTKAFLNSFSFALRNELKDTSVTVSCLMPGPTETEFFRRGDLMDSDVGQAKKDPAEKVAQDGFDAMMNDEGDVVSGWKNKMQAAIANITPAPLLAEQHRKMAAPGTAKN
ncbi:SDR family NAD(P)-dependent oxidoreductase [Aureimonas psammosilenae]|uniref:SDR family NAD(P)-dependent oxidoreductase n=1 Tax=Aureimonas psammosilenae TaxID=2495496 RepID=UPI00186A1718|nr:SDR family NAD(P)-dependent oxidoreductase [Aureimonas psammosilenae]